VRGKIIQAREYVENVLKIRLICLASRAAARAGLSLTYSISGQSERLERSERNKSLFM